MYTVTPADVIFKQSIQAWLPRDFPFDNKNIYVAGGFIRAYFAGETPNDMDLYFEHEADLQSILAKIKNCFSTTGFFETDRAVSIKMKNENGDYKKVQLIKYCYGDPESIISMFDFTICKAIYRFGTDYITIHSDFFKDLSGRILNFTGSPEPLSSLARAFKYVKRSYHICDENILLLCKAIHDAKIFEDEEKEKRALDGLDPAGGRRIRRID